MQFKLNVVLSKWPPTPNNHLKQYRTWGLYKTQRFFTFEVLKIWKRLYVDVFLWIEGEKQLWGGSRIFWRGGHFRENLPKSELFHVKSCNFKEIWPPKVVLPNHPLDPQVSIVWCRQQIASHTDAVILCCPLCQYIYACSLRMTFSGRTELLKFCELTAAVEENNL